MAEQEQSVVPEKYRFIVYLIERVGVLAVVCAVLMWFMGTEFRSFRREILEGQKAIREEVNKTVQNSRAIVQKLGIPVVFRDERK